MAAFEVEQYLPDFIASIEAQGDSLQGVEIVAVDGGALDGSGEILDEGAARRPDLARVVHQENGGVSRSRSAGIALATGEFLYSPDPDDMLAPGYAVAVRRALDRDPVVDVAITIIVFYKEAAKSLSDTHPLRLRFDRGDVVVDLDRFPDYFHLSTNATFMSSSRFVEHGLTYVPRVVPHFEDGRLVSRLVLRGQTQMVAVVASAEPRHRKRGRGDSLVDVAASKLERYIDLLRYGHLGHP
ncbi:glycosyltransferase [Sanguibacter sp. HDW7]|uniref:glycosyltransferase n=1 Tax=Sanguibacter sp. HDW7 TaxID=2714931 RepID=UPI00140D9A69|nr:glycosyltransferase [Sanguibacter sp. HDW7]QIK82868.1 glycosyltransferase [Sanguibacter sp. HDW7]